MKRYRLPHVFYAYHDNGFLWFRIFGFGIVIKDTTKHAPSFSEKYGYTKTLRLGKYSISMLGEG